MSEQAGTEVPHSGSGAGTDVLLDENRPLADLMQDEFSVSDPTADSSERPNKQRRTFSGMHAPMFAGGINVVDDLDYDEEWNDENFPGEISEPMEFQDNEDGV